MNRDRITSLVGAAQTGDALAFARLVHAYQDMAVAYAMSVLGDYHLAEDAAQEAFVEMHRSLASLREPAAFIGWFRKVLFKHCDRMRRGKRHPMTGLDAALTVPSPEPSPHEALESHEVQQSVHEAIAALSDAERTVVLLYYMGDHSHTAIAGFLRITPNAVKTRLYSARQRLRRLMEQIEENLNAARPSRDRTFADKVERLIRPDALTKNEPLFWSPGMGVDVWEMFRAAITGDLKTVRRLLDKAPELVRCAHDYRNPLSFAVQENRLEVAAFLLARGADPIGSGTSDTLLQIARDRGHEEMQRLLESALPGVHSLSREGAPVAAAIRARDAAKVRSLLDASPGLVHAPDEGSNRPIHWAAMTRQLEVIDDLLARGADIDAQRSDGARPIQLANGDYEYRGWRDVPGDVTTTPRQVIDHLRARGAYCDICTAAHIGDLERMRALLDEDSSLANRPSDYVSYYACSGTPLRNAAAAGHLEIVRLLLERGADPNLPEEGLAPRGHALYSAVSNGHFDIAGLLLENGAYPNPPVESSADALLIALSKADEKMVELLCSYGAACPVGLLAYGGDVRTAAAVFAANPALADDPDALENAAGQGHEPFVRLMLRYRPDLAARVAVGVRSKGPQSPIKTRELTEFLFRNGMNPSLPNWLRITPLHRFAQRGDVESAAIFIDHGADLNARDEELCSTPLGWAAKFGQIEMVGLLLERGAKTNLPDDPSWATPLAWATRRGHREIAEMLKQHGAT